MIVTLLHEGKEMDIIRNLFREYEKELDADLCFQSFEQELKDPLKKYGAPEGLLMLAYENGEPAGCVAFTPIAEEGKKVCEMKRLYVRPSFRKYGIGKTLVKEVLSRAKQSGYESMRLDTLQKLQPAIRLYKEFGFHERAPYYENPLPEVVYMEKDL